MGTLRLRPKINLLGEPPPKLKWYNIYHFYKPAGDILASFELIFLNVIF